MDFKRINPAMISIVLAIIFFLGLFLWRTLIKNDGVFQENSETATEDNLKNSEPIPIIRPEITDETLSEGKIQEQLEEDRQQQKLTKELKIKLEQTNLELEQEKSIDQIDKLRKENTGAFNEPMVDGQNNLPQIKVDYIGGNDSRKEAIISIGGTSYQIKISSNPTDDIQVLAISDNSVTLHFKAPIVLTKTFEFKPE